MSRILPSQLSYEQLLELLNEAEEKPMETLDNPDDVITFLTTYEIVPGETKVSKKLLYKLYKTYSKNPVDNIQFQLKVGQFIEPRSTYYLINKDNFAISQHIYKEQKKRDKTKVLVYQKHFNWFLTEKKVERGTKWLEGFILFYIYKSFCKERRVHPKLGYVNFHKFLKLNFDSRRIKENRALFFRVDQDTAELLTEMDKGIIRDARSKKETGRSKEESSSGNKTS